MMNKTTLIAALVFSAAAAAAQEPAAPKKWKSSAELSSVQTSGNSKTSTISAKDLYSYDWEKSALELVVGGLGTRSRSVVTAEQYNAAEKISFKFQGRDYAFQKVAWDKNRFSGIKDRYDIGGGFGRTMIDRPYDKFFVELGGGYIIEDRLRSANQSFGSYRGYAKYIRNISATSSASQDAEYLGSMKEGDDYRINTESALTASVSTHCSMKASYVRKYVNRPGDGFKKTDTITGISLIVNY